MDQSVKEKAPLASSVTLVSHGHSDVGFLRETNEDSFLNRLEKGLFAVADGVGGLPFGALASLLAMQNLDACIQGPGSCTNEQEFVEIVRTIHKNLLHSGEIVGGQNGIGTTFSALRSLGDRFMFAQVGDSVVFHFDGSSNSLKQVSRSHTLEAELLAKHGPDAANDMPEHYAHTLTRCMGQEIDFDVDLGSIEVRAGDTLMICSDGLTNMVEFETIEKLCGELEVKELVHQLIDLANQNGGVDNSTVVCIRAQ